MLILGCYLNLWDCCDAHTFLNICQKGGVLTLSLPNMCDFAFFILQMQYIYIYMKLKDAYSLEGKL